MEIQIFIERVRKRILHKLWNTQLAKLISIYEKNSRKHFIILDKLRSFNEVKVDKVLDEYYTRMKKRYMNLISKWIKRSRMITVIIRYFIETFRNI